MCENKQFDIVASSNGISYYVTTNSTGTERRFGVGATLDNDQSDTGIVENIFFTMEEATECCKWLAENDVFPVTLSEVISDFYQL